MNRMLAACAALLAIAAPASAQPYPSRPVTVVVPFPAGGPSDVVARIVAEGMGKVLGQTMVIENVGGAGGTIGSGRVASALMMVSVLARHRRVEGPLDLEDVVLVEPMDFDDGARRVGTGAP